MLIPLIAFVVTALFFALFLTALANMDSWLGWLHYRLKISETALAIGIFSFFIGACAAAVAYLSQQP